MEEQKRPWPFYGYAPGNYGNACSICKKEIWGVDKLCFVCLECAIGAAQKDIERMFKTIEICKVSLPVLKILCQKIGLTLGAKKADELLEIVNNISIENNSNQ